MHESTFRAIGDTLWEEATMRMRVKQALRTLSWLRVNKFAFLLPKYFDNTCV